jgi:cytochrome c oxidase subunit 2
VHEFYAVPFFRNEASDNVKRTTIFAALFAFGALAFFHLHASTQDAPKNDVHEIQVTAKKYEFEPNPIVVKKGEHVKLVVTATDRDHGIEIEEFHVDQKLHKGQPTTIEFTPDKAGTFPFKCSVVCGFGHGKMKGKVVVEE